MDLLLKNLQVIDYKAHASLYSHLAETFADSQLDVMFDCVGDGVLFEQSQGYLKPEGRFISIVGGHSQGVIPFIKYKLVPTFLGGIPRSYQILGLQPSGTWAGEVLNWVEERLVKEIPIDSELDMNELLQVRWNIQYL
jgi:threonine dehydrogenase-like Zn-dependent dehydrogenase